MAFKLDFCHLLILSSALAYATCQIAISSQKTPAVQEHCGVTLPYQFQLSADQYEGNDDVEQATKDMYPIDGDQLVREFLKNGISGFSTVMGKDSRTSGLNYGILLAGLGLTLVIAPILVCCCCCPENCPPVTCRDPNKQYKNCELCWPNICIIVFSCGIIVLSSFILIESRNFDSYYKDFKCSMSLVTNNFLYGTKNHQGSGFFTGLVTISDELENLTRYLPPLAKQIQNLTNSSIIITEFEKQGSNVLSSIARLPNGQDQFEMTLTYQIPFLSNSPTSSIPSTFPGRLGTKEQNTTMVGSWYSETQKFINSTANITGPSFTFLSNLQQLQSTNFTAMRQAVDDVESVNFKISKTFSILDHGLLNVILIGSYVILGMTIFFSFTLLLGACGLLCYKYSCRNMVYCSCILLWILCLVHFIFALFFSFSTPLIYYGCIYLTEGFDEPALFEKNLEPIFDNSTIGNLLSQCLTPNNGDQLLQKFVDQDVYLSISSLSMISKGLSEFNATRLTETYANSYFGIQKQIEKYQYGEFIDFESEVQLQEMIKISKSSEYPECSSSGFKSDSWIPSVKQSPVYVACQVSGPNSSLAECGNYFFVNRLENCQGCMDSYSIMSEYYSKSDVVATMNSRYPDCENFTSEFGNLWANYYKIKRDVIDGVLDRVSTTKESADGLQDYFSSTVSQYFKTQQSSLNSRYGRVMDPQQGVLAGLDCTAIKDDINIAMQIFCVNGLKTSYYLRFLFAAIAFSLCFLLCCGICTGTRHYMQQKIQDQSRESMAKKRAQEEVQLMERQLSEKRFTRYY